MSVKWHYVSLESVTERVISPSPIYDALNDHLMLTACCVVYCNILIAELYIQSFFFFFYKRCQCQYVCNIQVGESWFTKDDCSERCMCYPLNNVTCEAWNCSPAQECKVHEGQLGCVDTGMYCSNPVIVL